MSCITIVYQDEIGGGLQVRSEEGKWMEIEPCDETLVVNIGDSMQAWSNGKLRSSEHRVVLKQRVSRFSLAFFWCFEYEKVIYASQEVVADYLKFRESNEEGKFEKVGFTVKEFHGNTGEGSQDWEFVVYTKSSLLFRNPGFWGFIFQTLSFGGRKSTDDEDEEDDDDFALL
ncbi:PREDICTED: gibberellin [Prunus dulcis]|uniref:PREDICTED: gibberellin n=1 Tax=Prunus dulcis TaxID=3755 RepID=A0A5E4E2Q3_PRUDU|nr:PREDICTED: gibberellin [Prunus dulcis]